MKRILANILMAMVALATLSCVASADTITFGGVGPTGLLSPVSCSNCTTYEGTDPHSLLALVETQSSPLGTVPPGITGFDYFTFSLYSANVIPGTFQIQLDSALLTANGYVFADNGCSTGAQSTAGCAGLFTYVTVSDPGQLTGELTLGVNQTFQLANSLAAGTAVTTPVSTSVLGDCNGIGTSVSAQSQFTAPGGTATVNPFGGPPLSSGPCAGAFSLSSAPQTLTISGGTTGVADLDVETDMSFSLNSGSISLPAGTCLSSTCVAPAIVTTPPPIATPEPSSLFLLGSGILALLGFAKRQIIHPRTAAA